MLVTRGPVHRWGLGYVHSGEVLLSRHPRGTADEVDFFATLEKVQSDYVIGAAVTEDDGLEGNENTQPFRFRRWLFAQEGGIGGFAEVMPVLLEHIPDYLRRNIQGRLPAEAVFHLFLSMLHDSGNIDDPNLDLAVTRRALRDTLAFVESIVTRTGDGAGPGNIVLTNSRSMLALRLGVPLFVRRLKQKTDPRLPESEFKAVLCVSAEANPGEGFEEIPERSVVAISRDIHTDIIELDS
jgi:predicted glutamine amidotransferase